MSEEKTAIEQKLFEWDSWAEIEEGDWQFHDCTLKAKIGNHEIGDRIDCIIVRASKSTLKIMHGYDKAREAWKVLEEYELSYSVGKIIDKK